MAGVSTHPRSDVEVLDLEVVVTYASVVRSGVMFCEIITEVRTTGLPVNFELALIASVANPIKTHIHCFGSLLFDGVVDDAVGC